MTAAIESQFPQETFTDIPIDETEEAVSKFKESYALSGRRSSLGKEYIAGVSLRDENPLEGMNCRSDGKDVYKRQGTGSGRRTGRSSAGPGYGRRRTS